ncbi:MAG: HAD family hydrolase [Verrucomicrobiales bacterium]
MLLLFDIDGTLIDTGGAGLTSLSETARELYGGEGPPLDLAGSTDGGVLLGIFSHFNVEPEPGEFERFYAHYEEKLRDNLASGRFDEGQVLPGVPELLAQLAESDHSLGLLTGNTAAGAAIKTAHYGLAHYFPFGAYGDDHHDRNKLGPIALERAEKSIGRPFSPADTLIIGDTPKDIACARACGAKVAAVATGKFTRAELAAYEPDILLDNLLGWQP